MPPRKRGVEKNYVRIEKIKPDAITAFAEHFRFEVEKIKRFADSLNKILVRSFLPIYKQRNTDSNSSPNGHRDLVQN